MPLIAVAAIGAAATIGGALISSNAASSASKTAAQTAASNNQLQQQIYSSNQGELQPYIDRGNAAGNAESALLGVGGDPAAAQSAFGDYLNSTGYNFQLGQGVNAITSNRAASGVLDSGGTLKSLNAFGQNTASTYFQNYLGNLNGISGTGLSAAGALAGVGQNYANASNTNSNTAASASENAGLASASSINGLLASGVNAYGLYSGLSSYGGGASGGAMKAAAY